MTAQEQQMLQGLTDRINRTGLQDKDTDAEQFIQQTLGRNPDALYLMAQTVLVQDYALNQAQKQLADLRAQLDQARRQAPEAKHTGSFLGNLLGRHDEPQPAAPPPPPPPPPMQAQYVGQGVGPGLAYPSGGYPIPNEPMPQSGGFLRSAMQTATGVAAGALAFEGIESLMHGFGHSAGYGTEFAGSGFGGAPREEIVNNYYGDASPHEHHEDASSVADRRDDVSDRHDDSSGFDHAPDANDGARFKDASYVTDGTDSSANAGANADDVSGTGDTDYSGQGDDSMLSDDVGDQGSDSDGGFDSGGDSSSF
jgi:hypothetical protein